MSGIRFPLKLPCGHRPMDNCRCSRAAYGYGEQKQSQITLAHDLNLGQWRQVLEGYGCHLPSGRHHGPCPICGGKDRFRFDDKQGRGTWYCSHCEPHAGDGLSLLSRYINKSIVDTAKELTDHLSTRTVIQPRRPIPTLEDENKIREQNYAQARKAAQTLMNIAVNSQHKYLINKGIFEDCFVNGEMIIDYKGNRYRAGELLLVPVYKNGELINVQRITQDGVKRPLFGGEMAGGYHFLPPLPGNSGRMIGVCEGYATGISARLLTNAPIYVAFSAGNLAAVAEMAIMENPGCQLILFADNDEPDAESGRCPGEHYARAAAAPHNSVVLLPPEIGDWDDMRIKYGTDEARKMLKEAWIASRN